MIRFAFYGRAARAAVSDVADKQERDTQLAQLLAHTYGGQIVAEYYDHDVSRRQPWTTRTQARALLDALTDPGRTFGAVLIPRADALGYHGAKVLPRFAEAGVAVWVSCIDKPVDLANPQDRLMLGVLGVLPDPTLTRLQPRAGETR